MRNKSHNQKQKMKHMKKILSIMAVALLVVIGAYGQSPSPGIFNYQGVARNSVGNVLVNKTITLRLTIHDGAAAGPTVYQESRTTTTNPFGLFNVQVGSAGASSVTGTIAGVTWGVNTKFIQVEIDPNGGTTFINIGTAQIASVPYSLYSSLSNDLVLPFLKTQAASGTTLIGLTNSATTGTQGAFTGTSASTDGNAFAITGTISSTTPGGFSSGVRGVNNGTGGLGIGVYGSQNGSGWGVYGTTPSGIGVHGSSASGFGVYGLSTSGVGVYGTSNTGNGGLFEVTNAASTADALRATTAGTGASWAIRGISSGTNGAGLFQQTNATNTSNNLQSNQAGLGRAGLFNATNAASTANAVDINVAGTGFGLRIASTNGAPKALQTVGGLQLTGINEGLNKILASDATGNATWQTAAAVGVVTGSGTLNFVPKWTPSGTNLGNSLLFDDGASVALGTTTPTHRFTVNHSGSTGIGVNSTSGFSVVDINAASGDAALRFGAAGVNQWNMRNRPGDNYLEIFELGGGGSRMVIQDATGNVGIGETTNPTYRLDVLHAGSTGIRSRSSGSFSVVDIDAASGDAALRFQSAGVGQWNTRNRPGDNYYEIFELGGGGSRVVIQDGTGNVGIGETTSPSYKLDVLHGGSTGIRSRSSGSFSVVDIDAASGDAALRFANNGVNQWNVRNQPGTDNLQIFELGGGGERMHIQDGTGNISIGGEPNPTYRLDVLHGGATGIRSRSSSTFSLMDIDAANGDAALRFIKAGVNQWNTRNNPATDDYQIFELGGGGERLRIENTTGNIVIPGNLAKGGGSFRIDHPLDPENKYLYHSFVESPDMMNIYNGNIVTDASGKATVELPTYFEALNMEFRYQLTVIGSFAQAIINKEVLNNKFEIATSTPNVKVSWQVTGIRHDAYANQNRIPTEVDKAAKDKGTYIHPKAFNQPITRAENYYDGNGGGASSLNDMPKVAPRIAPPTTGGSLDQGAIVPPVANKVAEKGGSLDQGAIVLPAANKAVEKGGSTEDVPAVKTEAKPTPSSKGGSVEEMPKPAENKRTSTDPGSTKTE